MSIRIVAGADVADTVEAPLLQPLVVEVRKGGQLKAGAVVQFTSLQATDTTRRRAIASAVAKVKEGIFGNTASETTDASGRASVLVQLGTVAGEARVQVTCPELGITDTARFTVLPGKAAQVILGVADTAVRVGGTYDIRAYSADKFSNARSQDGVTYQAIDAAGTVSATGTVRAGLAVSRGTVLARAGGFEDSAYYTVVPVAKITAIYEGPDAVRKLVTMDLDGANLRVISPTVPVANWANASHSPTEDLIAYNGTGGIALTSGNGSARLLVTSALASQAYYPTFSTDGKSIYFMGQSIATPSFGIWRIGVDGSGLTQVAKSNDIESTYAVSPDGTRMAFSQLNGLWFHSLAPSDSQLMGPTGWFPDFSPDGKLVAYSDNGALRIVGGTSAPTINVGTADYARVSWLPDNRWLLTRRNDGPVLVNSIDYRIVPLPSLWRLREITIDH